MKLFLEMENQVLNLDFFKVQIKELLFYFYLLLYVN